MRAARLEVYIHLVGIHTVSGATGEGHEPLDPYSNIAVNTVEVTVTSFNPKGRVIGTGDIPRGIWQVGQVGLGYFNDDPSGNVPDILFEPHSIHQECEGWYIHNGQQGAVYYGSVWWRLNAGVTADISVTW